MAHCELLDYSDRDDSLEPLVEYHRGTQRSKASLPAEVLPDQMAQIKEGDEIAIFNN